MPKVTIIEPKISKEENERNLEKVKEVLMKIARHIASNNEA